MKTRGRFAFPQAMLAVVLIGGLPAAMGQTGNANDRPLLLPTRDVDVTYEIPQGSRTLAQRLRWIASARKLRVDPPIPDLFVIIDYDQKRMSMVRDRERTVIDMAAPEQFVSGMEGRLATASRKGDQVVSGLPCTDWQTRDFHNQPATACITADGVLLEARSHGRTVLMASSVRYTAQDPAVFQIPQDYVHVSSDTLPQMPAR